MRWILILLVLLLFTGSVLILGKNVPSEPAFIQTPESRQYTVIYKEGVFSPTNLRIRVNDTVVFENKSTAVIALASFSSGDIIPDAVFSHRFLVPGMYAYHNDYKSQEQGTIIVR